MNSEIKTYYIPKNPNIIKGRIYTLYINNNNNLDLYGVINTKTIKIPTQSQTDSIMLSGQDYTKLLELNNRTYQLNNNRSINIQKFITEENKTITELSKINSERQELIKKLTNRKEK